MPTALSFRPLGDRLIVEPSEAEEVTAHGIIIPEMAQSRSMRGKVMAVGPGHLNEVGVRVPMDVGEGDYILFAKYAGTEVHILGARVLILRESDILAIIELNENAEG